MTAINLAGAIAGKKKDDTPTVYGLETEAVRLTELREQLDELTAEIKLLEEEVRTAATDLLEAEGVWCSSVLINGAKVRVVIREAYRSLDPEAVQLPPTLAGFLTPAPKVKLAKGVTANQLRAVAGDLFTVEDVVKPARGFADAAIREGVPVSAVLSICTAPQVRTK